MDKKEIINFQQKILSWYAEHKQELPWRESRDPYRILVSEVMLQQTQVSRVMPKFEAWLKKFPTLASLAKASVPEVLQYWSGLGYNRRALFLKKAASEIVEKYKGKFPQDEKILRSLPGIGKYTARAILCFAFDEQIAVIDTNVRKVILTQFKKEIGTSRYALGESNKNHDSSFILHDSVREVKITEKEMQEIAEKLLPIGKAYDWNQALMDYSRMMLQKEKVPVPKQSKFLGSRRYYRGKIIKILLEKKKIAASQIGYLIKKDFIVTDTVWLEDVLKELEGEGFILINKQVISLTS